VKPILYLGNRNYSSWSMRPWLALTWGKIQHEARVIPLGGEGYGERRMQSVLAKSLTGTVPVLHLGDEVIHDSLAISEWAAEQQPELWPRDARARAQARAAVCEMHSGFSALRSNLPCNVRRRAEPRQHAEAVQRDIDRMQAIWTNLASRFGGPYLFGAAPTIADAFFTPVATRFRTYAVKLSSDAQRYADTLLADPAFLEWEREAVREEWKMPVWDSI
jgi:glutathione S-transferase